MLLNVVLYISHFLAQLASGVTLDEGQMGMADIFDHILVLLISHVLIFPLFLRNFLVMKKSIPSSK